MKTIFLTLFLFAVSKYTIAQEASLGINYFPNGMFDSNNMRVEAGYYLGEPVKYGAFLRANDDFKELSCGLGLSTSILKLGECCELNLTTAIGFEFEQQEATRFDTDYHRNYAEIGASVVYEISENYFIKQTFCKQYYGQAPTTYFGAAVVYKLK